MTGSDQHGVPRVSATTFDRSDASIEKEKKQIEAYKQLEGEVSTKVFAHILDCLRLKNTVC